MAKKVYIGAENFPKIALPAGYTQLEYIESSGSQYIDTGFQPNQDTRVVVDFEVIASSDTYQTIFAARDADLARCFSLFVTPNNTNFYPNIGQKLDYYNFTTEVPVSGRHIADCNKNVVTIDGYSHAFTARTFQNTTSLYLFACNENLTTSFYGSMKMYSCKIYNNSILSRDYVPCINESGVIGLYDLVNSTFYASSGSGAFINGSSYTRNVAMDVNEMYVGDSSVARKIASGYIGKSGVARQFWNKGGTSLGNLSLGRSVFMNVNGVSTEFIVVHQGLPSSDYDASCDGTWLLMKDCYEQRAWDSSNNDYANSDIHAYLNGTFINLLDTDINNAILSIKLPYTNGTGDSGTVVYGSNGLATKVFLLSYVEVGLSGYQYAATEGVVLDYFNGAPNDQKYAYYNGSIATWWLRSPNKYSDVVLDQAMVVGKNDYTIYQTSSAVTNSSGVRPCLVMPSDAIIDSNGNVIPPPVPPATLGNLSAGDTVFMNVDGVSTEFIVVNQGLPSSDYDSSCDGTWLLMKDIHTKLTMSTTVYAESDVHTYLNETFVGMLDPSIKRIIRNAKIPYTIGSWATTAVGTGADGLSVMVFVLSEREVSTYYSVATNAEGSILEYFNDGDTKATRVAYYEGTATVWWLRSPYLNYGGRMYSVTAGGGYGNQLIDTAFGVRPCLILPSDTGIDSNYNVTPPPLPTTLGELNVGDTVYMNVNGISTEFIAVNQGLPSSDYDSSCDGTWLLMKDCVTTMKWDAANNDYQNSDAHTYLNGTFLSMLDFGIQKAIKQAKIPYQNGTGSGGSLATGASGLSTKPFLLSYTEVGFSGSSYAKVEGTVLDYFKGANDSKRIAYLDGTATRWWLRSPNTSSASHVWCVDSDGSTANGGITYSNGVRPCIILPSTTGINESYTVTPPPVTVNTLSVGDTVKIKVNGVATEFIIVNKGRPSTAYDSSCDGVWVLMKDIYELREWHSSALNYYYGSTIHSYLNNTFLNLIESNVRSVIKQVRIPHTNGYGNRGSVSSGSSGLSTKIFLPSAAEVGFDSNHIDAGRKFNIEGATLSYFSGLGTNNTKRNAFYNGSGKRWWTRSPGASTSYDVIAVEYTTYSGYIYGIVDVQATYPWGVRPAFVLPYTAVIDENNNIIG